MSALLVRLLRSHGKGGFILRFVFSGSDGVSAGGLAKAPAVPAWLAGAFVALLLSSAYLAAHWLTGTRAEERGHVYSHSFGASGSGEGQFDEPWGVAVNETLDDIYVADHGNDRVEIFHETPAGKDEYVSEFNGSGLLPNEGTEAGAGGEPGEIKTGLFDGPTQIAIDNSCHYHKLTGGACEKFDPSNGDVYVIDLGHFVIDKYTPTGKYVGQITGSEKGGRFEHELTGVAVGQEGAVDVGALYQGKAAEPRIFFYNHNSQNTACTTCAIPEFEPGLRQEAFLGEALAVDTQGNIYAHLHRLSQPDKVGVYEPSGEEVRLIDEAPWGLAAEFLDDDVYVGSGSAISRYGPAGELVERFEREHLEGGAVAVDGATGDIFASDRSADVVDVFGLEPPGVATVKNSKALSVGTSSVRLAATINPRGFAATYQMEYGLCSPSGCAMSGYEAKVPSSEGVAGERFEPIEVSVPVSGLSTDSRYHFHAVVRNQAGVTEGEEIVFTTRSAGSGSILDGRAWEQVSPAAKGGALFAPIGEQGVSEASTTGGALAYLASDPTEAEPAGYANAVQVLSVRKAAGQWISLDIPTRHETPPGKSVGAGQEYRFFSSDLTQALVEPLGEFTALSTAASEQTPYVRSNFGDGTNGFCSESCYRPLVTGCPEAGEACAPPIEALADVPPGTVFGIAGPQCATIQICGPEARAASPDLSAVVLQAKESLSPGHPAGLYEWTGGQLYFAGSAVQSGSAGVVWANDGGTRLVAGDVNGAVPLRLVDPITEESVDLDAGEGCGGCESGDAEYPWISAEGARVFFRDKRALTENADRGAEAADLYVCQIPSEKAECELTDLTPKQGSGHADVLGVVGANEGGSVVYFVANGVLAAGAVDGTCSEESTNTRGECNLYAVQREASGWGEPKLVAVLSGSDRPDWNPTYLPEHTARASGGWLVFMSDRPLTGYDNRDAVSGEPDEEVFAYDSSGTGSLACVSCDPTGERPHGREYGRLSSLVSGDQVWPPDRWVAANVPGWTPFALERSDYQSRYLDADGRLFFNSSDGLVGVDQNGGEDVYEWEPVGVGSCSEGSGLLDPGTGGCLGLVSSGSSGEESGFLDASADGSDAFFLTSAKLVLGDTDDALDVYDAHECSAAAPCVSKLASPPPAECSGLEACRPYASSKPGSGVASEVFGGFGNVLSESAPVAVVKKLTRAQKLANALKACRKDRVRTKRKACEGRARKAYGTKAAKKAETARRKLSRKNTRRLLRGVRHG